jgi:hypothetical protein
MSGSNTFRVVGTGNGVRSVTFETNKIALTANGTAVLLRTASLSTTNDRISASGRISQSLAKSAVLRPLRESGDTNKVSTAFGAFRRLRQDGGRIETVVPPTSRSPPLQPQDSVILDFSLSPVGPTQVEWSATIGLEQPRPRDPVDSGTGDQIIDFAEQDVSVAGGTTESVTISGVSPSEVGDFTATVSSPTDSDQALVSTVLPDATAFSFPGATIALQGRQVGQIDRGQSGGRETLTFSIQVGSREVRKLLAVGSRVEGSTLRDATNARNFPRDTVPGDELTASVSTTAGVDLPSELLLQDWSVDLSREGDRTPFRADLSFIDKTGISQADSRELDTNATYNRSTYNQSTYD